jgi:hypothetical protein
MRMQIQLRILLWHRGNLSTTLKNWCISQGEEDKQRVLTLVDSSSYGFTEWDLYN